MPKSSISDGFDIIFLFRFVLNKIRIRVFDTCVMIYVIIMLLSTLFKVKLYTYIITFGYRNTTFHIQEKCFQFRRINFED